MIVQTCTGERMVGGVALALVVVPPPRLEIAQPPLDAARAAREALELPQPPAGVLVQLAQRLDDVVVERLLVVRVRPHRLQRGTTRQLPRMRTGRALVGVVRGLEDGGVE